MTITPTAKQKKAAYDFLRRRKAKQLKPVIGEFLAPVFVQGVTTTAEYINAWQRMQRTTPATYQNALSRPAPFLVGPEVIVELDDEVRDE